MPSLDHIDLGSLLFLAGHCFNSKILERLQSDGHVTVKMSYGYVIQHLLEGASTASSLGRKLGISQQAASKRIKEMLEAGLIQESNTGNGRERAIELSVAGIKLVGEARAHRAQLSEELFGNIGKDERTRFRSVLENVIRQLDKEEIVEKRAVQESI